MKIRCRLSCKCGQLSGDWRDEEVFPFAKEPSSDRPRVLYKYMSMHAFRNVIESRAVRASHVHAFNDPFDGQIDHFRDFARGEFERAVARRFAELVVRGDLDQLRDVSRQELSCLRRNAARLRDPKNYVINYFLSRIDGPSFHDDLTRDSNDAVRHERVFCLSDVVDSAVMWAFYADDGKGVAIAVDSEKLERCLGLSAHKVVYDDTVGQACTLEEAANAFWSKTQALLSREMVHREVIQKSCDWSFEREWRMVFSHVPACCCWCTSCNVAYTAILVSKDVIQGVYIGARVGEECTDEIVKVLDREQCTHISLFKMRPDHGRLKLVPEPLSV